MNHQYAGCLYLYTTVFGMTTLGQVSSCVFLVLPNTKSVKARGARPRATMPRQWWMRHYWRMRTSAMLTNG